jgi:hypothetical protein
VRARLSSIAADELRHGALAWAVADWASTSLSARQRASIERARSLTVQQLRRELDVDPPPELVRIGGLPNRQEARALFQSMVSALWPSDASAALA